MKNRKYQLNSWIGPRLEVRTSLLGGKGLFAKEPIKKGKIVIVWGGTLMTEDEINSGNYRKGTSVEVGEGLYLAGKTDESAGIDDLLNHSCNPNLWLQDEVMLIAKRDIKEDEELTADYGTWVSRPKWKMDCNCNSKMCRHTITGNDWQRKDLQERYKNHFSPYLNERIKKMVK